MSDSTKPITPADKDECVRLAITFGETVLTERMGKPIDVVLAAIDARDKARRELCKFAIALATKARETT